MAGSRLRLLLWLWRTLPLSRWLRSAYVRLTHRKFLVGVIAYITNDRGEVLLFRHTYRRRNEWSLPSGYLEANESPAEGIAREVREESGLEIVAGEILAAGFYESDQLDVLFACQIVGGRFRSTPEVDGWRFVATGRLAAILPNHLRLLRQARLIT